jgi:hypothetical protein
MTCAIVTIGNRWRLKSKPCWLLSMKTPLLISDPDVSKEIKFLKFGKAFKINA